MNILEVYKKYQTMPQLMDHQLKVAGVAKLICDHFASGKGTETPQLLNSAGKEIQIDRNNIITACLLHDMGNIIKFSLSETGKMFPGKFTEGDLAFWQKVKDEFIAKYGNDEHQSSVKIAKETGAGERVAELVDCIGFQNGQKNADSDDFGKKICAYSDMRVGPTGAVSLEERFADLRARYDRKHRVMGGNENLRREFESGLKKIEQQIFGQCNIGQEDITDERVALQTKGLKEFEI